MNKETAEHYYDLFQKTFEGEQAYQQDRLSVSRSYYIAGCLKGYELASEESKDIKVKWEKVSSQFAEICYDCDPERKEKCLMFPEFCEGEYKELVNLDTLVENAITNELIRQKEAKIQELESEIKELRRK